MSLTGALRDELAHADGASRTRQLAEARAMLDLGGSLQLRGGQRGVSATVHCAQGAVARRLRSHVVVVLGLPAPEVQQVTGSSLRGGDGWRVQLPPEVVRALGRVDDDGRPVPPELHGDVVGYLAGGLMVSGSLSGAGAAVHMELRCPGPELADRLVQEVVRARVVGDRVVVKSADGARAWLAQVGAHRTFLAFDEGRMRRELRRQVTRTVNADRANLRRATRAAAGQVRAIARVVDGMGWEGVPEDLVPVALARVANPEASLADIGELLDPPVGKATVHRRLQRLVALAEDVAEAER